MPKFLQIFVPGRAFLKERKEKDEIGESYFVYRDGLAVTGTTKSIYIHSSVTPTPDQTSSMA
jgi:hypothetical protein